MFHYNKGLTYSTSAGSQLLYQDAQANTLLNNVFCYFVHHLPKFQNMHPYRITSATDIPAHVGTTYPALQGPPAVPETYLVSKELVAYLEMLSLATTVLTTVAWLVGWSSFTRRHSPATKNSSAQIFTSTLPGR